MSADCCAEQPATRIRLPSLATALGIMLGGSVYPPIMTDSAGRADHMLAIAFFWAMSAGFVHGVGFVPKAVALRWIFSGWACLAALSLASWLKFLH